MKKEKLNDPTTIKPDLKHDSMEYAASTDGDDILDIDTESREEIEEAEISGDELALLEAEGVEGQAAALNDVEMDRQADNDVSFDEDDLEAFEVDEADDNDEEKMPRK